MTKTLTEIQPLEPKILSCPFTLIVNKEQFQVKDLPDASKTFLAKKTGISYGTLLNVKGEAFAHISPNGCVWEGAEPTKPGESRKLLQDSASDSPMLNPNKKF